MPVLMGFFDGITMNYIQIKDWNKMQHYKHRNPPWIKLYAEMLDDETFEFMSDMAKLVYFCLLLFASRKGNKIRNDSKWINRKLPIDGEITDDHISELLRAGFLSVCDNDSDMLALRYQDAIPEKSRVETELEKSKSKKQASNKDRFLDFVYITTEEYKKLLDRFGGLGASNKIAALNEYIGSTGKKYKSHYHTILMWARKDAVGKPKVVTKEDSDVIQWNKNRTWVEQSTLAQLKAHPAFMANMANDKFRAWAETVNVIIKEIA